MNLQPVGLLNISFAKMADPAQRAYLGGVVLDHLVMTRIAVQHAIDVMDPSTIKVPRGKITLTTEGSWDVATPDSLIKYKTNKAGDILIWASLTDANREAVINFIENVPNPPDQEMSENQNKLLDDLAVILMSYYLHGTLAKLMGDNSAIPLFARNSVMRQGVKMTGNYWTSVDSFFSAKFPNLVEAFIACFGVYSGPLKNRLRLGFAGNRCFSIAKVLNGRIPDTHVHEIWAATLFDAAVLRRAPFVSFHPSHPMNPLENCSKYVFAYLGDLCRQHKIDIDKLHDDLPGLLTDVIVKRLKVKKSDCGQNRPDNTRFDAAVAAQYSIGDM